MARPGSPELYVVEAAPTADVTGRATVEKTTIAGCVPTDDNNWIDGLAPVVISRTADRIIVAGQLDDDEAWMVTGTDGATEAQVLQVARGLRP